MQALLIVTLAFQLAPPDMNVYAIQSVQAPERVNVGRLPRPGSCLEGPVPAVWVVHRGGDYCAGVVTFLGLEIGLDVRCDSGVVETLMTDDPAFRVDGIGVGSTVSQAIFSGGSLKSDGCEVHLRSGWVAEIGEDCRDQGTRAEILRFRYSKR